MFVSNLPEGTTADGLRQLFAPFGELSSVALSDKPGTGFVSFSNPENAAIAQTRMDKWKQQNGQFLIVNWHVSKKDNEQNGKSKFLNPIAQNISATFNANVYIRFIPLTVTEEELKEKFSFGDAEKHNILSVKLNVKEYKTGDKSEKAWQYAYVLYSSVQSAQLAIQRFDGVFAFGNQGGRPVSVEMWRSKDEIE